MAPPVLSSRQVEAALLRAGFAKTRRAKGSHQSFTDENGRVVIVKMGQKAIPSGTMRSILRQAGMTAEEFAAHVR